MPDGLPPVVEIVQARGEAVDEVLATLPPAFLHRLARKRTGAARVVELPEELGAMQSLGAGDCRASLLHAAEGPEPRVQSVLGEVFSQALRAVMPNQTRSRCSWKWLWQMCAF